MQPQKILTRREIRDRRIGLADDVVKRLSAIICANVIKTDEYKSADTLCIYISINKEVDTRPLIEACIRDGKRIAAPRITDGVMDFYYFDDMSELQPGFFDILEPTGDDKADVDKALIIMPGVAFDENRNRIGYGGGYYDRYLYEHNVKNTIALAYEVQIVDKVEADSYDIKPDMIITEGRTIR